ncbi:hypothetical protein HAX54_006251 [Datura stramonium]|uniref:Uncharacterized protein n=1 Tax=Datura stramonium TaxID=4076 RepID=A0ABS8WVY9_DATST|nr:hypothetical protein [Datura stramonium]
MSRSFFNSASVTPVTRKAMREGEGKETLSEPFADEILPTAPNVDGVEVVGGTAMKASSALVAAPYALV